MDDSNRQIAPAELTLPGDWDWPEMIWGERRSSLAAALVRAVPARRWFGSKTRAVQAAEVVDAAEVTPTAWQLLVRMLYDSGHSEVYQITLAFVPGSAEINAGAALPWMIVRDAAGQVQGTICDAVADAAFCGRLLDLFSSRRVERGQAGRIEARTTASFAALAGDNPQALVPRPVLVEQSNTSIVYGERLILKLFRRIEPGLNPDVEVSRFLTAHGFERTPPLAGWLEYAAAGETWSLGMLQQFVPNQGDAWKHTLDWLIPFLAAGDNPRENHDFLPRAERLGSRTAELHLALAADATDAAFAPEPFSTTDSQAIWQQAQAMAADTFDLLRRQLDKLDATTRILAERVLAGAANINQRYEHLLTAPITAAKTRCHGDYHLGQVLVADDDFLIIDFEGEPARPLADRRQKQLALRDAAGMVRSFHYASCTAATIASAADQSRRPDYERRARAWYESTRDVFLAAYHRRAAGAAFLPKSDEELERLLSGCLLEKAIYELRYELNNRPDWVDLPLVALAELAGQ